MYILADTIESSIGTYKQGLKYHPIQLDRKKRENVPYLSYRLLMQNQWLVHNQVTENNPIK